MRPQFFARNSLVVLVVVAFLLPLMYVGTREALRSNNNDVKAWLPAAYEETSTYQWYRERFESDLFVLASWEGCTLDNPALERLARKLVPPEGGQEEPPFFKRAVTGRQLFDELVEKQGLSEEEAIARLKGFVIGPDGRQTCLILTVAQESEPIWDAQCAAGKRPRQKFFHAVLDRVYAVAEHECGIPRDQLHLGGPPVDNVAIDQEGEKSLMRLAGVSGAVGLAMAWWCLRSWILTAMVFSSALFSAGLALLVVPLCGGSMNAILLTMPSLVYVAAVSAAIHLANYYRDTVRQHGFDGAADRAVRSARLPLALATGTTAIGLASMGITELIPIREFGLYSAVGVVLGFGVVTFYMPAMLHLVPVRGILAVHAAPRRFYVGLGPRWRAVAEFILRRNGWVTLGCLVLLALGAWGLTRTESSVKLMRLFSPKARIIGDYAWLEQRLGPLVPMEVVIRFDDTRCKLDLLERMVLVHDVQQAMRRLPDVGSVLAASTFARTPPRRANLIERRTWIVQINRHRDALRDWLMKDGEEELWRVSARVAALTNLDYGEFVHAIRGVVEPVLARWQAQGIDGVSATYTGLVPLIYKTQDSMLRGFIYNFIGDLILVAVAMVALTRNASSGLLLGLPSVFPIVVVFGAMGWLGIVIDVGTVMVPAVALGVTVDDAIHFMLWCRHGQQRGMSPRQAILFAYEDCARAIYQSWGVIGLGLSAFALSTFTPTQRFGILMFAMLTVSSLGNLVLLPALLAGPAGALFWKPSGRAAIKPEPAEQKPLGATTSARFEEPTEKQFEQEPEEIIVPMGAHLADQRAPHRVPIRPRRASR